MSVAPDPLLRSAPEIKPKAAAAKAPAKTAEPRDNKASSFAQVYAKERQAKASERGEAAAKPAHEANGEAQEAPADAAAEQPALADSGKSLPSDPPLEEAALDPLLLMGLAGQPAQEPSGAADGETGLPAVPASSLQGSGPASLTEASFDPELDALNQLPAVRMALELGAKAKAALAEQGAPTSAAMQAAGGGGQGFAANMLAMGVQQAQGDGGEAAEVPLIELTVQGLEALKESVADNRAENFVGKLAAAAEAVTQQPTPLPRAAMAAGQPVSMQHGGWGEEVVDRVMWLSSQNLKSAEIQLDPAELGRLEVRISLNQEQTQVTFASANAGVRDALEGQLHRLRELFTQQGMNLLDVNVSDQSLSRGGQGRDGDDSGRRGADPGLLAGGEDEHAASAVELKGSPLASGRGMVDYYA